MRFHLGCISSRLLTDLGLVQRVFDLGSGNVFCQSTLVSSLHLAALLTGARARAGIVGRGILGLVTHGCLGNADRLQRTTASRHESIRIITSENLGMPNRLEAHLGELHAGLSHLARDLGFRDILSLSTFSGLAGLLIRRSRSRGFLLVLLVIARVVSLLSL
jgi:hypothetical protein